MKPRMPKQNATKIEVPSFFIEMGKGMKMGMVNMHEDDVSEWSSLGETTQVYFERVSQFFNWTDLFPEWIDEEEESDVPSCPEIPMPEFAAYETMDVIIAKLPCKYPEEGWGRDVFRLSNAYKHLLQNFLEILNYHLSVVSNFCFYIVSLSCLCLFLYFLSV